jgi:hypothetical protein
MHHLRDDDEAADEEEAELMSWPISLRTSTSQSDTIVPTIADTGTVNILPSELALLSLLAVISAEAREAGEVAEAAEDASPTLLLFLISKLALSPGSSRSA